ncbi:sporulation protein YqfC [Sulfoacidibacillus thermotolerans]|uniref:Sporulation protein YqfC n=1 Tax=Sulfoacidibacillus thermotolerans TaxID=1765684 RepID=A0A2U3D6E9_SULT2|nr:sporulation protein YqfC [Sulfoacidibacillus thermotolerans]PWI56844.1 sporulation protein YqfC [Sulfoacidibacillus thermotolerans]
MKRRWRDKTEHMAAELLEIPKDTLLHVPRVMLIGNEQVVVDNYKSILSFEPELIRIALAKGEVAIKGTRLAFKVIVPEQLVIEGTVSSVDFH